jgi:hypothetical protein
VHLKHIPLDLLSEETGLLASTRAGKTEISSPREGIDEKTNTFSYLSPAYSKPILKVWAPEYVKHIIALDEGMEQAIEGTAVAEDSSPSRRWISLQNLG